MLAHVETKNCFVVFSISYVAKLRSYLNQKFLTKSIVTEERKTIKKDKKKKTKEPKKRKRTIFIQIIKK